MFNYDFNSQAYKIAQTINTGNVDTDMAEAWKYGEEVATYMAMRWGTFL